MIAVRDEQAFAASADVLLRRTRLGLLAARALVGRRQRAARAVAEAMGGELGWDADRVERELRLGRGGGGRGRGADRPMSTRARPCRTAGRRGDPARRRAARPRLRDRVGCGHARRERRAARDGDLNATPESFSDGAQVAGASLEAQVERGARAARGRRRPVDVGGESGVTDRPAVRAEEESARVVPLVERLAAEGVPVSVDTWKARWRARRSTRARR